MASSSSASRPISSDSSQAAAEAGSAARHEYTVRRDRLHALAARETLPVSARTPWNSAFFIVVQDVQDAGMGPGDWGGGNGGL